MAVLGTAAFLLSFFKAFAGISVMSVNHPEWGVMTGGVNAWRAGQPGVVIALLLLLGTAACSAGLLGKLINSKSSRLVRILAMIASVTSVVLLTFAKFQPPHDGMYDEELGGMGLVEGFGWSGDLTLLLALLISGCTVVLFIRHRRKAS